MLPVFDLINEIPVLQICEIKRYLSSNYRKINFEINIYTLSLLLQHLVSMRPKTDRRQDNNHKNEKRETIELIYLHVLTDYLKLKFTFSHDMKIMWKG